MNERDRDRHSVKCYFCGVECDEREVMDANPYNGGDGGSICNPCKEHRDSIFAAARPWTASEGRIYADGGARWIADCEKVPGPASDEEVDANAMLIVKCVNMHDELVQMVCMLEKMITDGDVTTVELAEARALLKREKEYGP